MITTQYIAAPVAVGYQDNYCIKFNGTSQAAKLTNPSWRNDISGGWEFWAKVDTLLSADGAMGLVSLAETTATTTNLFSILVRRNGSLPSPTNTYFDVTERGLISSTSIVRGSAAAGVPIVAGTWYHIVFGNDSIFYINGVSQTMTQWAPYAMATSGWYGNLGGSTNRTHVFGGGWNGAGSVNSFLNGKMNNALRLNRALTSTEALEGYTAGMGTDPATRSYASAIGNAYYFENNCLDSISTENATAVGSPTYVTP